MVEWLGPDKGEGAFLLDTRRCRHAQCSSFLSGIAAEHVVKIWEAEGTPGAPGKPQDILKEGLSKLPDLGKCLRREVPSWVCADMNDEQAGVYVRLLGPPLLTLR